MNMGEVQVQPQMGGVLPSPTCQPHRSARTANKGTRSFRNKGRLVLVAMN